jgi:hypothetical protein
MSVKRRNIRIIEINVGLFLIFSVISILIAILLRFDYTVPNATIEDDIDFLAENITPQRVSAIAWLIAGLLNLSFLPLYLILFRRFQKSILIINGLLILCMAFIFFKLGITELNIAKIVNHSFGSTILINSQDTTFFLLNVKKVISLFKIGTSSLGAFATLFTISNFREIKFPVFGSSLAFLGGPILIAFTWLNPDQIIATSALALTMMGLLIIGAFLVNRGLIKKTA